MSRFKGKSKRTGKKITERKKTYNVKLSGDFSGSLLCMSLFECKFILFQPLFPSHYEYLVRVSLCVHKLAVRVKCTNSRPKMYEK